MCWEWRCSWSSADRRCSNYIWVINNLIAYKGVSYIRDLTVLTMQRWCHCSPTRSCQSIAVPHGWTQSPEKNIRNNNNLKRDQFKFINNSLLQKKLLRISSWQPSQCSWNVFFWSSDNMPDDFEQIIKHFEKNHEPFDVKYTGKVFPMIRQYHVWWLWTNHPTFCKIISNVWWADGFSGTLPSQLAVQRVSTCTMCHALTQICHRLKDSQHQRVRKA